MLNYSLFDEHSGSGSRFTYALHTPEQQERFLADLKQEHLLVAQGAQINYLSSTLQTPLDLLHNTPLPSYLETPGH